MITASTPPATYAELWDRTCDLLAPLGLTELDSAPNWSRATGADDRFQLSTASWNVGPGNPYLAICRAAKLTGPGVDAFVAVILPNIPEHVPAFTAELYATEGRPTLAFLDLPSPGLDADTRNEVADQTTVLTIRHAPFLPRDETPPSWVVDDSPGGFLYTRTTDRDAVARLSQAFDDYLNVWIDFAFPFADRAAAHHPADGLLNRFKLRTSRHAFTRTMLAGHYGSEWASRFVLEFLFH